MYENKSNSVSDGMRIAGAGGGPNHATSITARDVVSGDPAGPIASEVKRLNGRANALIDLAETLQAKLESVLYPVGVEAKPGEAGATPVVCNHQADLCEIGAKLNRVHESLSSLLNRVAL